MKISEHQIQKSFFQWLQYYKPVLDSTFAIPNGGSRNVLEAVNLKLTGVKSGVPDIFVSIPSESHHGLYIELKSQKGILSANQKEVIDRFRKNGYHCVVCHSFEEAKDALENYLGGLSKWCQCNSSGKL